MTGWSCALALAKSDVDVVLADRAFGAGAACRSGGIIVGDTLTGPAAGFDGCDEILRSWIATCAADVEATWHGVLELDRDASLPSTPIDWTDNGPVRVSRQVSGGAVDPAALLSRLAAVSVARNVRFVDGCGINRLSGSRAGVAVDTTAGLITAGTVLMATDATAHADAFIPWPICAFTVALETDPLSDDQVSQLGWTGRQPFYTNDLPLLWGRSLSNGALLAGRELIEGDTPSSCLPDAIASAGDLLLTRLRTMHPALAQIGRTRVWAGPIARDAAGVPSIHADPDVAGVWWAGGYGGHGLAQAFVLGQQAASRLNTRLKPAPASPERYS